MPVLQPLLPRAAALAPYLDRIDERRIYANWGPLNTELEQRLAERLSLPGGGICTAASGTAAVTGAILGIAGRPTHPRNVALLPAFTFIATALAAEQCGYRVRIVDVDPDTWMLDHRALAARTDLDSVGLVIPVAPFGVRVPTDRWLAFYEETGIPVVIDAAAAVDQVARNPEMAGPLPLAVSLHATKVLSSGEGGAIISSNPALIERCAQALNCGLTNDRLCDRPSINGKLSEYHAAVGLADLDQFDYKLANLNRLADVYRSALAAHGLDSRLISCPEISAAYVLFACESPDEAVAVERALLSAKIDYRRWYGGGLQSHPYLRTQERVDTPGTDRLSKTLIGLPVAPDLAPSVVGRIAAVLAGTISASHRPKSRSVAAQD